MGQIVVSLAAMFTSLALFIAGTALLGTVLAVQLADASFPASVIGMVLVCHSIGFVFGSRVALHLIRRVGQIRSFAAFAAVGCAAALIHPIFINVWLWAALRGLVGFCSAGLIMVLESWISGRATPGTRGALLGIYQVVYFFAAALGQYLVAFGARGGVPIYSLVAILIVLSLVPMAVTRSEAPVIGLAGRLGFRALYALSPSGLFGGFIGGVIISAFLTLAPVYASAIGMALDGISRYMVFAVVATMLLQWPVGRLSDVFDRRWLVAVLTLLAMVGAVMAMYFGARHLWVLCAATAPLFGLAGCFYPICLSMINDGMDDGDPLAASAGLLLVYGLGTCVGPLAGALAMQRFGPAGLFAFLAGIFGFYALLVFWRGFNTPGVPIEDQGRYVTIYPTEIGPVILDLDPRTDPYEETPLVSDTDVGSDESARATH